MPASRCAPSWTKRNIPKASRSPISRWLTSTSPATRSMATGTIRFHLIEKITVQNELTELFMDEPLAFGLQVIHSRTLYHHISAFRRAPRRRLDDLDARLRVLHTRKIRRQFLCFRHV